ncbi:hypothetical protein FOA52_005971 [Chlamydomonas sp. UWO 241]|nr:hypothetical protein FOA52_005971 [Chlamydomonas sp. UWO 241]
MAPPPVTLTSVLKAAPQLFGRDKVSVVERFVTVLDVLPQRYQQAQVVYLSKNSLRSLAGIGQFRAARSVSLADNLVGDWDSLEPLAVGCPLLESLTLEGNPLAGMPYYRAHVVVSLPNLKSLDGRAVSDGERGQAGRLVEQEASLMAVLLRSACSAHKLGRTFQQLQLHVELYRVMYGQRRHLMSGLFPTSVPVNPHKVLEMWDYEGSLTSQERRLIEGALRREVCRDFQRMKGDGGAAPTWDDAFAQVMLAQGHTTAQLMELMHAAKDVLASVVAARLASAPRGELHGEAESRARGAAADRDALVTDLRDALQVLSPGGRAPTPVRMTADARSPKALCERVNRTLYSVTRGARVGGGATARASPLPLAAAARSPLLALAAVEQRIARQLRHHHQRQTDFSLPLPPQSQPAGGAHAAAAATSSGSPEREASFDAWPGGGGSGGGASDDASTSAAAPPTGHSGGGKGSGGGGGARLSTQSTPAPLTGASLSRAGGDVGSSGPSTVPVQPGRWDGGHGRPTGACPAPTLHATPTTASQQQRHASGQFSASGQAQRRHALLSGADVAGLLLRTRQLHDEMLAQQRYEQQRQQQVPDCEMLAQQRQLAEAEMLFRLQQQQQEQQEHMAESEGGQQQVAEDDILYQQQQRQQQEQQQQMAESEMSSQQQEQRRMVEAGMLYQQQQQQQQQVMAEAESQMLYQQEHEQRLMAEAATAAYGSSMGASPSGPHQLPQAPAWSQQQQQQQQQFVQQPRHSVTTWSPSQAASQPQWSAHAMFGPPIGGGHATYTVSTGHMPMATPVVAHVHATAAAGRSGKAASAAPPRAAAHTPPSPLSTASHAGRGGGTGATNAYYAPRAYGRDDHNPSEAGRDAPPPPLSYAPSLAAATDGASPSSRCTSLGGSLAAGASSAVHASARGQGGGAPAAPASTFLGGGLAAGASSAVHASAHGQGGGAPAAPASDFLRSSLAAGVFSAVHASAYGQGDGAPAAPASDFFGGGLAAPAHRQRGGAPVAAAAAAPLGGAGDGESLDRAAAAFFSSRGYTLPAPSAGAAGSAGGEGWGGASAAPEGAHAHPRGGDWGQGAARGPGTVDVASAAAWRAGGGGAAAAPGGRDASLRWSAPPAGSHADAAPAEWGAHARASLGGGVSHAELCALLAGHGLVYARERAAEDAGGVLSYECETLSPVPSRHGDGGGAGGRGWGRGGGALQRGAGAGSPPATPEATVQPAPLPSADGGGRVRTQAVFTGGGWDGARAGAAAAAHLSLPHPQHHDPQQQHPQQQYRHGDHAAASASANATLAVPQRLMLLPATAPHDGASGQPHASGGPLPAGHASQPGLLGSVALLGSGAALAFTAGAEELLGSSREAGGSQVPVDWRWATDLAGSQPAGGGGGADPHHLAHHPQQQQQHVAGLMATPAAAARPLSAAMTGVAAGGAGAGSAGLLPSPLMRAPGTVAKELEGRVAALAMQRHALEKALLTEQGGARLARQELGQRAGDAARMAREVEALRTALGDAQMALRAEADDLEDAQTGLREAAERQEKAEARDQELTAQLAAASRELQTRKTDLASQLAERQAREAAMAAELAEQRAVVVSRTALEDAVMDMCESLRLRRSFDRFRAGVVASRKARTKEAAASQLAARRALQRCLRRWRTVLHCTRVLRRVATRCGVRRLQEAMRTWRARVSRAAAKARALAGARKHWAAAAVARALRGWRVAARAAATAADPEAVPQELARAAAAQRDGALARCALGAWREYVGVHRRTKIVAHARASRYHARATLRKALGRWGLFVALRFDKARRSAWLAHRCRAGLLRAAWGGWLGVVAREGGVRLAQASGARRLVHRVLVAWHEEAGLRRALRARVLAAMGARSELSLQVAFEALRGKVAEGRLKARRLRIALGMWRHRLLASCFWPWLRASEAAMAARAQAGAMQLYRTTLQAALRWHNLSAGLRRQQAVVERAVRMYSHRVVGGTQRAVLQAWAAESARARDCRRSAAAAFVQAALLALDRQRVSRAFGAWAAQRSRALRTAKSDLTARLAATRIEADDASEKLVRSRGENARLLAQLLESDTRCAQLAESLESSATENADLAARLAQSEEHAAERESALCAEVAAAQAAASEIAEELDGLWGEVFQLGKELARARATEAELRDLLGKGETDAAQAEGALRDASLRMTQQAAKYEGQMADVRDELASALRDGESARGAAARAEQACSDVSAELAAAREMYAARVAGLRRDVKAREEQLEFLQAHLAQAQAVEQARLAQAQDAAARKEAATRDAHAQLVSTHVTAATTPPRQHAHGGGAAYGTLPAHHLPPHHYGSPTARASMQALMQTRT